MDIDNIKDWVPSVRNEGGNSNGNGRWESFWKWMVGLTIVLILALVTGYANQLDRRLEIIEGNTKELLERSVVNQQNNISQDRDISRIDQRLDTHIINHE